MLGYKKGIDLRLCANHFDARQAPTLMALLAGRREEYKTIVLDQDKCYEDKQGNRESDWGIILIG